MEKGTVTQSSILTWEISWTEEAGGLQSMGLQKKLSTTLRLNNNPGLDSYNELGIGFLSLCMFQSPSLRYPQMILPKCHFLLKYL